MEKKSAVHATILWKMILESRGMYWLKAHSFILVMRFLQTVRSRRL